MGDLLTAKHEKLAGGLLKLLFMHDQHSLELMLEDVLGGQEWKGVIQVGGGRQALSFASCKLSFLCRLSKCGRHSHAPHWVRE